MTKKPTPLKKQDVNHPRPMELSPEQLQACHQLASGEYVADAILGLLQKIKAHQEGRSG